MFSEISRHILDIYQNSADAGADLVKIIMKADSENGRLSIEISDNGRGIRETETEKVLDPFYTSGKRQTTGLGLPLFRQSAIMTGGTFEISSSEINGTTVRAVYNCLHPDCPQIGKLAEDMSAAVMNENTADILFEFTSANDGFSFDTRTLRAGNPINTFTVYNRIQGIIKENLEKIKLVSYGGNIFRTRRKNNEN